MIMNKPIEELYKILKNEEKGRIKKRPPVSFVPDSTNHDSVRDMANFIKVVCS